VVSHQFVNQSTPESRRISSFSRHLRTPPPVDAGNARAADVEIPHHRPWDAPGRAETRSSAASTTDPGWLQWGGCPSWSRLRVGLDSLGGEPDVQLDALKGRRTTNRDQQVLDILSGAPRIVGFEGSEDIEDLGLGLLALDSEEAGVVVVRGGGHHVVLGGVVGALSMVVF
jgi:hypothetical protein